MFKVLRRWDRDLAKTIWATGLLGQKTLYSSIRLGNRVKLTKKLSSGKRVRRPSLDEITSIAKSAYLTLSPEEKESIEGLVDEILVNYDIVDSLPEPSLGKNEGKRDGGSRPSKGEDPYNA